MMECPIQNTANPDILLDYCAGKLSGSSLHDFEKHAENCPECRLFVSRQEVVGLALESWEPAPMSDEFDRKLYARIEQHEQGWPKRAWSQIRVPFGWRPALPAAAIGATLALAIAIYQPGSSPTPVAKESTRLETLEAEQVERALEDLEMLTQLAAPAQPRSL